MSGFSTSVWCLLKGEVCEDLKKMLRMKGSGRERKRRRVWEGVTTAGEKAVSLLCPHCQPCGHTSCCHYECKQNKRKIVGDKEGGGGKHNFNINIEVIIKRD